jgi:Flp pilus assembly protein TadD
VRILNARTVLSTFLLSFVLLAPVTAAQTGTDAADKAERTKAIDLFNKNQCLDALPLFEDLSAKSPNDATLLLGLAACLITHSATQDAQTAAQERARAKDLLLKAQSLGNNSTLLQNLLQGLQAIPQSGAAKYSEVPAADEAMHNAEAAFASRDFDKAISEYSRALALDPKNTGAALFVGDSYFARGDFAHAGEWYGRASQIDPNSETPYRYYADMLTRQGDMAGARAKVIESIVAEPYNPITWRGAGQWATVAHVQLVVPHVNVPNRAQKDGAQPGKQVDIDAAWLAYGNSKATWQESKFREQFPQETQYRHSLAQETDALQAAAKSWSDSKDKHMASKPEDPNLDLLVRIYQADMIEPYVLLNAADAGIAADYDGYRAKNRAKLEQYLSQFVVPPAPAKP